ncbi:MAG: T9SS type B sorting domain-containing protein [Flavobacteriaceae bacterium]|nr:T9SS type B sorting domain-containing protein [Flavobacteriaceae bacterium]
MKGWALLLFFALTSSLSNAQECPNPDMPGAGQNNVPVETMISWEEVTGITGYIISIGTTFGGDDIINEQPTGSDPFFSPPLGLPESTEIFVTITLFFFDQPDIICESYSFFTENVTTPPACTAVSSPPDMAVDVNVGTNIVWDYAPKAIGYRITIGTAPGLGDIENNLDVGNTLSYDPPTDFPPGTTIYVEVNPYNENGNATNCAEQSFTTGEIGDPPACTMLKSPLDGEPNVPLTPLIEWFPAPGATGYRLYVGTSPFNNDVLDGVVFTATSTFVIDFDPNTTYWIRIVPFNKAGEAQGCPQESFSTILGCGPFIDPDTGELIDLNPEINFPEVVGICENNIPTRISTEDTAEGFRWYFINQFGEEVLISEEAFVDISETGFYVYEAYNTIDSKGESIECISSQEFEVRLSSKAVIEEIQIGQVADLFYIDVEVSGLGDYEFSIESSDGPYQDFSIFNALTIGNYTLYVRDKNGCGITEKDFRIAKPPTGFPPYFSPNGDGFNDFWQYVKPDDNPILVKSIFIYDRFGKLLANFGRASRGWDGMYNNNPMPSGGYWFKATTRDNRVIKGYFSLVR